MSNPISEFKKLVKESSKDWEKNKERFSSRILGSGSSSDASASYSGTPDGAAVASQFSHPNENWGSSSDSGLDLVIESGVSASFSKEKRKAQLDLGHLVLDYFKEEPFQEKVTAKRDGPGRPRKPQEEKVKTIAIKIRPEYIDMLKNLSFGRGMGTRIRMIIDQWNDLKKREKEQVEVLRKAVGELDGALKKYAKNYNRAENLEGNEIVIKQMEKACNNIRILLNVLKFELSELKGLLTKEEYKNVEFSIHYQPFKR